MLGNPFPFSWKTRDRAKQSKWVRGRRQRKRIVNVFDVQVRDVIKVNPKEDDAKLQEKKKRVKEILWRRSRLKMREDRMRGRNKHHHHHRLVSLWSWQLFSLFFSGTCSHNEWLWENFCICSNLYSGKRVWRVIRQRRKPRKEKNQANSTNNNDKREETNKRSEKNKEQTDIENDRWKDSPNTSWRDGSSIASNVSIAFMMIVSKF